MITIDGKKNIYVSGILERKYQRISQRMRV